MDPKITSYYTLSYDQRTENGPVFGRTEYYHLSEYDKVIHEYNSMKANRDRYPRASLWVTTRLA